MTLTCKNVNARVVLHHWFSRALCFVLPWTQRLVVEAFQMSLTFYVFPPPSITNHPSQTFAEFLRFHNHLCCSAGRFWFWWLVLSCANWLTNHTNCAAVMLPLLPSSSSPDPLQLHQKRNVCVCVCVRAGCLEMWGRIFHLLTSLFHLVSGFTQKTSVEPSSSSEAIVSRPPFTRSSVNLSLCVWCLWCWGVCIGN